MRWPPCCTSPMGRLTLYQVYCRQVPHIPHILQAGPAVTTHPADILKYCVQVDMYTAHHDRRRCFEETVDGPFSVTVCGSWFPRSVGSRFQAVCAYVRCIIIAIYVAWVAWRCGPRG